MNAIEIGVAQLQRQQESMNLRAWYNPKAPTDIREALTERQALGPWRLQPVAAVPERKWFLHEEELRLEDGSVLQVAAKCDCTFDGPTVTLSVRSGTNLLFVTSGTGTGGLTATVATGRGGLLALQLWFDRAESKR